MHPVWFFLNGVPTGGAIAPSVSLAGDGSVSAPSYAFASVPNTGMYNAGVQIIGWSVLGVSRMKFDSSNGLLRLPSDIAIGWNSGTNLDAGLIDTQLSRGAAGTVSLNVTTATPAGGSTALRLVFGSTSGFGIYVGSGAPTVSAAQGSIYLRSDGSSTSTRLYVNTNGSTTWTNVTTAA